MSINLKTAKALGFTILRHDRGARSSSWRGRGWMRPWRPEPRCPERWTMGRWWPRRGGGCSRRSNKRGILKAADAWAIPGAVGALLGREGLYSWHVVEWPRARTRGELAALTPKPRGRQLVPSMRAIGRIAELECQLAEMTGLAKRPVRCGTRR